MPSIASLLIQTNELSLCFDCCIFSTYRPVIFYGMLWLITVEKLLIVRFSLPIFAQSIIISLEENFLHID